jgi:hypothetical protein
MLALGDGYPTRILVNPADAQCPGGSLVTRLRESVRIQNIKRGIDTVLLGNRQSDANVGKFIL